MRPNNVVNTDEELIISKFSEVGRRKSTFELGMVIYTPVVLQPNIEKPVSCSSFTLFIKEFTLTLQDIQLTNFLGLSDI